MVWWLTTGYPQFQVVQSSNYQRCNICISTFFTCKVKMLWWGVSKFPTNIHKLKMDLLPSLIIGSKVIRDCWKAQSLTMSQCPKFFPNLYQCNRSFSIFKRFECLLKMRYLPSQVLIWHIRAIQRRSYCKVINTWNMKK